MTTTNPVLRPLGAFERLPMTMNATAEGINIISTTTVEAALSPELFRRAVDALQQRHPSLRCSIKPVEGEPCWVEDAGEIPIDHAEPGDGEAWKTRSSALMSLKYDQDQGPLARFVLYRRSDTANETWEYILAIHHGISDTQNARDISNQVNGYLAALLADQPLAVESLPIPVTIESVHESIPRDPAAPAHTREAQREGDVVLPLEVDAPIEERTMHFQSRRLDSDQVGRLVVRARQHETTLHGAVMAAQLKALYAMTTGSGPATSNCTSFIDFRRRVVPALGNETLGYYVGGVAGGGQFSYAIGEGVEFWDLARDVKADLELSFANGAMRDGVKPIPFITEQIADPKAFWNATFGAVQLSNAGPDRYTKDYEHLRWLDWKFVYGQPRRCGPAIITTMAGLHDAVYLNFEYVHPVLSDETGARFADSVIELLMRHGQ